MCKGTEVREYGDGGVGSCHAGRGGGSCAREGGVIKCL